MWWRVWLLLGGILASGSATAAPGGTPGCPACHGWRDAVTTPRPLGTPHDRLPMKHGPLWCLSCHVADAPEEVKNSDGAPLPMTQGSALCPACHGRKARQLQEGSHGKQLHSWRGERQSATCQSCHSPHAPAWQPKPPDPPPRPPWEARQHG